MSKEEIISQSVLVNGMKIIHRRRAGELSHIALMVNVGMRDELEDENGLAHFIEHLIFKGTKHRKAYHILSCLENVGGDLNYQGGDMCPRLFPQRTYQQGYGPLR